MQILELQVSYHLRNDLPTIPAVSSFSCPSDVARFLSPILSREAVEVFALLCLTTKHKVIAYHEVSRGTLDASLVHPREVYKVAFLANAASIILAHNHPSGDVTPSRDDISLTSRLAEAGTLLGVAVLDHLIIGRDGAYTSLKELGHLG